MNNADPFIEFKAWHLKAEQHEVKANAMTLSTATLNGHPSLRTVALAEYNTEEGFIFYTDYLSQKGQEMAENPNVALLFYWPNLYQQVRIEGVASKTSALLSDKYFYKRTKEKQLSASLSHQSERLPDVDAFLALYQTELAHINQLDITRPESWGGYQVYPSRFEFWSGSEVRMHTRLIYERENNLWRTYYLQP